MLRYYNGGHLPSEAILLRHPEIFHSADGRFGVDGPNICPLIYNTFVEDWREKFDAVHLLIRNDRIASWKWCFGDNPPEVLQFDEQNVLTLGNTFSDMCRDVLDFENKQ